MGGKLLDASAWLIFKAIKHNDLSITKIKKIDFFRVCSTFTPLRSRRMKLDE